MNDDSGAAGLRDGSPTRSTDQFARWCVETGRALTRAETARVEVYVRSLLPPPGAKEAQTEVLEDLKRVADGTAIQDVLVDVWGERLCLCESCRRTEVGRALFDRVRELQRWGEEYDASATSFFDRTHRESSLTGGSYDGIVPPRVTAALYVDGTVRGVFPCRFGDERYSVADFVESVGRLADPVDVGEPVGSAR